MNNYIEARFRFDLPTADETACSTPDVPPMTFETASDVLCAMLADEGYESFTTEDNVLTAYIAADRFSPAALAETLNTYPFDMVITTETNEIEGCDWNAEWEKNYFKPIVVDNLCCIHSSFHTDYPKCPYDIVIDPKMAFGTGHHATTSQIIRRLLQENLNNRQVIDMGTGTGILAILARMRGASKVVAIEIDPAAAANAQENINLNGCSDIDLRLGDASALKGAEADIFIANINRNIIMADMEAYAATLRPDAMVILSGFYEADIPILLEKANTLGLHEAAHTTEGDNWACLTLQKR